MFAVKLLIFMCAIELANAVLDSNSVHQNFDVTNKVRSNVKTVNDVKRGDQAVGGVHIFEFHAKGGGMGMGLKVLIFGIIVLFVAYWCLKEKCRTLLHSYRNPPIRRAVADLEGAIEMCTCLLYTSPSPRDKRQSRMPSSA